MPDIRLEGVSKYYRGERRHSLIPAVEDIDLTIKQGDFVFVTGSSGAGKSTLLRLIACQEKPTRGSLYLDGVDLTRLSRHRRAKYCLCMGYVPPFPELPRKQTLAEGLAAAAKAGHRPSLHSPAARAQRALALVGLAESAGRYPAELTLAETRRAELARAILNNPKILILDEITASLSDGDAWDIFLFLMELNRQGITIIMASNARKFINLLRRRVITLVDGAVRGDSPRGRYGDLN